MASRERNVKYLGLKALNKLVNINPQYALSHQMEVIEGLADLDETIQHLTLELLFSMTNPRSFLIETPLHLFFLTIDPALCSLALSKLAAMLLSFLTNLLRRFIAPMTNS